MEFRHEYKYIISEKQAAILKNRVSALMAQDLHAGKSGTYEIRSVYFDDADDNCYYQNDAGTDPRSKYRIRIYNASDKRIVLEKKMKQKGMTNKRQQSIGMDEYRMLMDDGVWNAGNAADTQADIAMTADYNFHKEPPLVKELLILKQTRLMQPKVIVAYERTPFIEPNGNVRVTFDDAIASSETFEDFFCPKLHKRSIMPLGYTLMEVKFDEFLPSYIRENLEIGHLRQTSFSKYYLCRRYHL